MGWANCGEDSKGRSIGYAHHGNCDHHGCTKPIHRGLAFACGDMHGEDVYSCEGYFCEKHMKYILIPAGDGRDGLRICYGCYEFLAKNGFLNDDDEIIDPDVKHDTRRRQS